jgi:hypothetical protein
LVCAAILTWNARYEMNPDGLSYIDIASETLRAGPSALVNGLWSPGYPALIAVMLGITHPSTEWEIPAVHFLNFVFFLFRPLGVPFIRDRFPEFAEARRPA